MEKFKVLVSIIDLEFHIKVEIGSSFLVTSRRALFAFYLFSFVFEIYFLLLRNHLNFIHSVKPIYCTGQVSRLVGISSCTPKKAAASTPDQGIYLSCRFHPLSGLTQEATNRCFLSHQCFSLPFSLSLSPHSSLSKINKHILG